MEWEVRVILARLLRWCLTPTKLAVPRSPRWPAVRASHLAAEPFCQACGGTKSLEVHHVVPVHIDRSLELYAPNLITLCEAPARNCHLTWGHCYAWKLVNPDVRADLVRWRQRVEEARRC